MEPGLYLRAGAGFEMVINSENILKNIINWISEYAKKYNKYLIVDLDPFNINSVLIAILCKKTKIPTVLVQDTALIDSKPAGKLIANALKLDLIQHNSFDIVEPLGKTVNEISLKKLSYAERGYSIVYDIGTDLFLKYIANKYGGIIVGHLTKELLWGNDFTKSCQGDILPLGDIYFSEAKSLFDELATEEIKNNTKHCNLCNMNFINSWADLEWAQREDLTYKIFDNEDPSKSREWQRYSGQQRKLIAKLNHQIKKTEHKNNNNPICNIRNIEGLTR